MDRGYQGVMEGVVTPSDIKPIPAQRVDPGLDRSRGWTGPSLSKDRLVQ